MATPSGNGLLAVWIDIAPEAEGEFNEWYNVDHVPALVGVPGVYGARRYVAVEGNPKPGRLRNERCPHPEERGLGQSAEFRVDAEDPAAPQRCSSRPQSPDLSVRSSFLTFPT